MKIVMADPPVINGKYRTNMPNLGILYLISYLRKNFDNLEIHYLEGFLGLEQHVKKVKEIGPDIYAMSFATPLADAAYQTAKVIRNEFPTLPIICGGAHPTANPEEVLTSSQVDVCVIGEGEATLTEFVGYYMNGSKQLGDIRGIAYKESGKVIRTPPRPLIENVDSIPFPTWDVFDLKNYRGETIVKARPHMMVIVSRGCPYSCNFCSNPVWKASKPWYRPRSPGNIAAEVELLYNNMGVRDIELRCDEFNVVPDWSIEVCNAIKKLGHRDLYCSTLLRVDNVTDELAKALNSINCWYVHIGIESGNQRTLDGINKQITLEQVVNACKILKRYDIKILGFFMMFNIWEEDGKLCYESPEDVMTTLKFARTLLSNKLIDLMSWGFVVPLLGAPLYGICQRHNLVLKHAKGLSKWGGSPVKLPGIEEEVMQRLKRKGMRLQIRYALLNSIRYINWRDWRYLLDKIGYIFKT